MINPLLLILLGLLILIIVVCLGWGNKLAELPIDVTRFGFNLKTNTLTLLILAGLVISYFLIYFVIDERKAVVVNLRTELAQAEVGKKTIESSLTRFQSYEIVFSLVFPESEKVQTGSIKAQLYITKQGQTPMLFETETVRGYKNEIYVRAPNLNPGDALKVIASESTGRQWESTGIIIPNLDLLMRRVSQ